MWWAMVVLVAVASGAGAAAAPRDSLPPLEVVQIDQIPPDNDNANWLSSLGGRYETGAGAPWLYYIDDLPKDSQATPAGRAKRRMPSLSIDLPMTVLRQKLSQNKERKFHAMRAAANRDYLDIIGKRGFQWRPAME